MGVVNDNEPPLKRAKVPLEEPKGFFELSSVTKPSGYSPGDLMARPLTSQGDGEMIGSKGVIKRTEFIKIITRALYSLGYEKTGALLEEESGVQLHSPLVKLFMRRVMEGKWDESVATLCKIDILDEKTMRSASFMILEQKFLEFMKADNLVAALDTLRNDIVPLQTNFSRVHELAASLVFPIRCSNFGRDIDDLKSRPTILERLQTVLPPSVMIPEKRLEQLVERALDVQRDACVFHNTSGGDFSLFSDHQCGRNHIPSQTMQLLEAHNDEVWFLQFSHKGDYLASSSKDQSAVIWEVKDDHNVVLKHRLEGHRKPVTSVSWSPDDRQLLTCGQEEVVRRWNVNSGECLHVYEKSVVGAVSCGWLPDSNGIFAGMTDKSICLWDLDGKELECWKGQRTVRISDVAMTDDGKRIISICRDNTILLLDREVMSERLIEEEGLITSFSLSKDSKFILVNLNNQEIHLWSIDDRPKLVTKYKGHIRTRFIIRSCFGGFNQAFIASGSEDSQVYIWHRGTGAFLMTLPGHSGAVNSVSWNPANLHMLASASDDHTIRIWGLGNLNHKQRDQSNGYCNGRI